MKRRVFLKSAVLTLGLCAMLLAVYASTVSLQGRIVALGDSLRGEAAALCSLIDGLERTVAREGASSRAGMRLEARSLDARLSRSLANVNELWSDLSRRIDRVGCEADARRPDAIAADGRVEGLLKRDADLARSLEEADRSLAAGRFADAAARYGAIVEWAPEDRDLRLKRAISLYRANPADSSSLNLVERDLQTVLASEGENAKALEILALVSTERQEWTRALGYFDRLVELDPHDAKSLREAGECALYAGKARNALKYLDEACAADPGDAESSRLREKARDAASSGADR
jgi:tetratricopeptide (TPR) repeat protein